MAWREVASWPLELAHTKRPDAAADIQAFLVELPGGQVTVRP
jgi:hypothetical protein